MDRWVCYSTGVCALPALWHNLPKSAACAHGQVGLLHYRCPCIICSLTLSSKVCCLCSRTGGFVTVQVSALPALWHSLPKSAACAHGQVGLVQSRCLCITCSHCLPNSDAHAHGQVGLLKYMCQCITCSLTLSSKVCCLCWWTGEFVATGVSAYPAVWHWLLKPAVCADGQLSL